MSAKFWVITLVVLLIGTNMYWLYTAIDTGVTMTYREASFDATEKGYEQAIRLANLDLLGMSADEAILRIGLDSYGSEPFEKEGCIYTAQVCVILDEDRKVVGFTAGANAL